MHGTAPCTPLQCSRQCPDDHPTQPDLSNSPVAAFLREHGTSLDHRETKVHRTSPYDTWYQNHRHRGDGPDRELTYTTLQSLSTSEAVLSRFKQCGSGAWVQRHKQCPHLIRLTSDKCRHRLCPACARERGAIVRKNLTHLTSQCPRRLALVTFTLAHVHRPLKERLDHLFESFKQLRRLHLWKLNVRAGVSIVEIKRGQDGDWHPHLHILIDAAWMDQRSLSAAWKACSLDSFIVDIRRISSKNGVNYVTKYVSKPVDTSCKITADVYREFITATKGRRLIAGLGAWRGVPLARNVAEEIDLSTDLDQSPEMWTNVGPLSEILERAHAGEAYAIQTLQLLGLAQGDPSCPTTTSPP